MSLAPKGTTGDKICVLLGLRSRLSCRNSSLVIFEMVGETYLHRIMEEEVIEARKNGRVEVDKIVFH